MQVHQAFDQLPDFKKAVITIGTFDGVHNGHKQILHALKNTAQSIGGESVLITFDPHPRKVVSSAILGIRLLNTLNEKIQLLADLKEQWQKNDENWQRVVNGMMKIYFSVKPPKNTLVSVEYRNRWYYISDSDTNSKQTLILLSNIAGLIQVAPNGSGTPPSLARAIISS